MEKTYKSSGIVSSQTQKKKNRMSSTNTNKNETIMNIWKNLRGDMIDIILSYLPIYKFWNTTMKLQSTQWLKIFHNYDNHNIFNYGKYYTSSIGYIKAYMTIGDHFQIPHPNDFFLQLGC